MAGLFTNQIKMTEQKLSQAERAIEDLADALGITEQELISILFIIFLSK